MGGRSTGMHRYSVGDAAKLLGLSERGVRKRIEAGTLAAERQGHKWWVLLPVVPGRVPGTDTGRTEQSGTENNSVPGSTEERVQPGAEQNGSADSQVEGLVQLWREEKEHVRELERTNMELAGQVGFLQGQLAAVQEQVRLLQAPKDEMEEETSEEGSMRREEEPRSFWQRFVDRAYGRTP